ncbi:hypothetical protein [Lacticaseibacillus rhamnosus]|nr:hypothetical protein [Lacticaseibacillus rhamnosus]
MRTEILVQNNVPESVPEFCPKTIEYRRKAQNKKARQVSFLS